jgi:apolipoprotein N-acyltransferase
MRDVRRSYPGLLRLTVLVGLVAFWVAVALGVALLARWPAGVVAVLGVGLAAALVTVLGLLAQVRVRAHSARRPVPRPVQGARTHRAA